jgi:hypothetical protein
MQAHSGLAEDDAVASMASVAVSTARWSLVKNVA